MMRNILYSLTFVLFGFSAFGQDLPSSINMVNIEGGTFTMGNNGLKGSPDQVAAAPEHEVTLSKYAISEAEITNAQYLEFLNAALADGLIEVNVGTMGPDKDAMLVQGTSKSGYSGKTLYNLSGIRVLKDHDDTDNDGDPFTGDVEPENPLNTSYIGYDDSKKEFYMKDPFNADDFDWKAMCDYQDYGTKKGERLPDIQNDFDDWSGAGNNLSDELQGWTSADPSKATNLPDKNTISAWPVTFVRWWGAWAFANYYGHSLPTEAQWEYAAKGGDNFEYAVYDGSTLTDANWNQDELKVATHHVRAAVSGKANPFGCYNLAGNAWEWIADNYVAPYSTDAVTDPLIEVNGSTKRCWRGGSWNYHQETLQSAMRFSDEEDRGNDHFGFRIAGEYVATGTGMIEDRSIRIFPNPAQDVVFIQLENEILNGYKLYRTDGKLVMQGETAMVALDGIANGVYFLRINTNHGIKTKKLLVKK
ncbi:MAG: SUMF1/EgtB/PvdO family nonheme iron enzyme [Bacteroidia bacterium]